MHFNMKSKGDSFARCDKATIFDGRNSKRARVIFVPWASTRFRPHRRPDIERIVELVQHRGFFFA